VYIAGRNETKCQEAAKRLQEHTGVKVRGIYIDISSMETINKCFHNILEGMDKIDILVNNAAFSSGGKLGEMTENDWIKGIDGTINGVFRTTEAVIPIMDKNKAGSIINIASMYGIVSPNPSIYGNSGYDNPPNYGAGKAAIIQFTRYSACHLAKNGIRVNAISPGPFPNSEVQENKIFIFNLEKKVPLGRIGKPHELKGVIVFLASEASSYITGENININGGWTAW